MALNTQLSAVTVNAQATTLANQCDAGVIKVYDGTQPATADTALGSNTLGVTLTMIAATASAQAQGAQGDTRREFVTSLHSASAQSGEAAFWLQVYAFVAASQSQSLRVAAGFPPKVVPGYPEVPVAPGMAALSTAMPIASVPVQLTAVSVPVDDYAVRVPVQSTSVFVPVDDVLSEVPA